MRAPILTFKRARALRRDMSLPEAVLWEHLRGRRLGGLRFRRQHPIGPYILDFYCAEARLAVEVEGWVHDSPEQALHDERRQGWLARRGIEVLRFSAKEVLKDDELEGVLLMIEQTAAPSTLPREAGEEDHAKHGGGGRSKDAAAAPSTAFGGPPPPLRGGGAETAPASDARQLHEQGRVASEKGFRLLRANAAPVEWTVSHGLVPYEDAVARMQARVAAIAAGEAAEQVWLLQHPPLYTAGTSARAADLLTPGRFPVHRTGRGGEYTYHGPGQRVAYVMLDLNARAPDLRRYVRALEAWIAAALARFGVRGEARPDRIGVWVRRSDKPPGAAGPAEDKIAAIGIRIRRWVTFHGIALNVAPDLEHFSGIVPCGLRGHGVTSLADLGIAATMDEVDAALRQEFEAIFGPTLSSKG